jgi:hypothetical protein
LVTAVFPIILIVLNLCAAAAYAWAGAWWKTCYWIAAAVLNVCVLKMR